MAEAHALPRRLAAEAIGSFFLFATVIGSGIMAENLAAVTTRSRSSATRSQPARCCSCSSPCSGRSPGAHMNPAVSLVAASRRELRWGDAAAYIAAQLRSASSAHGRRTCMFDLPTLHFR